MEPNKNIPENQPPQHSFPNSDRPLDSKEPIKGPADLNQPHETVKFKDLMENQTAKFINSDSEVPQIETYNSDVASAIKNNSVSALQIALAEQKKQEDRKVASNMDPTPSGSKGLIVKIIFSLLFLGIVIAVYLWWAGYLTPASSVTPINSNGTSTTAEVTTSPIKVEERQILSIDGKDSISIKNDIYSVRNGNLAAGTIKELLLGAKNIDASGKSTVRIINSGEWFSLLETHASPQLTRALADNYTMGVYGSNPRELFVIFNVKSYDNAVASMLTWESYLSEDLSRIFERNFPKVATSSVASSTKNIMTERVFTDKILFNKDTRILYDENGRSRMLYSFIDPKTLVIVSSETGLKEILSRFTTGKITR